MPSGEVKPAAANASSVERRAENACSPLDREHDERCDQRSCDQDPFGVTLRDLATHISEPGGWLRSEIDRLFDDFGSPARGLFNFGTRTDLAPVPALELVDDEKAYRLTAELPGLAEKDVEISVAAGVLTISVQRRRAHRYPRQG